MALPRETRQDDFGIDAQEASIREIQEGRQRLRFRATAFSWLQLAEVVELERDDQNRWTGFVTVRVLTMEASRNRVKIGLEAGGNGLFVGGPPEIHSLVVIGWLPTGRPIIVAKTVASIADLRERKDLPDLQEGEYFIRSGIVTLDDDGNPVHLPGASIYLDANGRIVLQDKDKTAEVLIGPALDSEGDPETDPQTGNPVLLRCRIKDASGAALATLYFDDEGNLTLEATDVNLLVDKLSVGENPNDGDQLVTRRWALTTFLTHIHSDPTSGFTGTPVEGAGTAFTGVLRSK